MKKSAADRNFNTCATTTTEDPIIRELRHQGQVFATDSILSTLMTASRSVNSWDIIVRRIGDKLFFDRRDGSEIDMVSVNETANEPPGEDNVGINDPRNLTLEATYINKVRTKSPQNGTSGTGELFGAKTNINILGFRSTMFETRRMERFGS